VAHHDGVRAVDRDAPCSAVHRPRACRIGRVAHDERTDVLVVEAVHVLLRSIALDDEPRIQTEAPAASQAWASLRT
jgi:hypothetical protein